MSHDERTFKLSTQSIFAALSASTFSNTFFAPRYWLTWIQIAFMRAFALLPFRAGLAMGAALGMLVYCFAIRRRRVTAVNIALCFPELDAMRQHQLVRAAFIAAGIGVIEIAWSWWGPPATPLHVVGREHFERALARGKGVLLLGGHFSTMDLGGRHFNQTIESFEAIQRPNANALLQWMIERGRRRFCHLIDRSDLRTVKRVLAANRTVWYAPDQDFGKSNSVFVPFFGQTAATLTMTTRLAKMSDAAVLFFRHQREQHGYVLEFMPLENFPSADAQSDAANYNRVLEQAIRQHCDQYLWMHKRFKTQPDGNQKLYREARC